VEILLSFLRFRSICIRSPPHVSWAYLPDHCSDVSAAPAATGTAGWVRLKSTAGRPPNIYARTAMRTLLNQTSSTQIHATICFADQVGVSIVSCPRPAMDWVLLRDGDGSGSDSDDCGCRVRVPGGSDSASEDGSDSGFAIVRVRRSDRPAGAAVSPVGGVVSDAPAMVAVPRPTPPGFCFKVVSYGEPFSASSSSSSSTDGGSDFLDETTIREALFGAAACSRGAGIDDGGTVTHEEDRESEVGEHDGTGSSVEAPRTSSASRTSVSPCKALPEVASGVEEEDAESSGEEEDMENSGEEEENDDASSGEEDSEISEEEEEEEQDVDGESSREDCFEIPATRYTAIDADDKGEQPGFPGRSYDDIDDSDDDMVPSSRTCTAHNAEQATGIEVPAPLLFWIDEDHQHDDIDTDSDMEEEGSSEPVCREYDGIDDSCGTESEGV
jgi:hypothetical protein